MVAKVNSSIGNYDKLPTDLRDSIKDQKERQMKAEQKEQEMELELIELECSL